MYDAIAKRIQNQKLRDMLAYFIKYVGSSPYDAPAVLNMMIYMQHKQGIWYVPGGMHGIANGIVSGGPQLGAGSAIGTGLVWVPVALYLVATGDYGKAAILAFCGFVVIGSVDNILRPILVGKSTKIPDFLVLVTTLGGVDLFGPNGLIVGPMIAGLFLSAWATIGNREIGEAVEEDGAADAAANTPHETAYPASSTQPPDSVPPEPEPT